MCPSGFKACEDSFLASADLAEYAVCVEDSAVADEVCPITSFAFTLESMTVDEANLYQQASNEDPNSASKFYFSKKVVGHAIDEVRVLSNKPCWNRNQSIKADN